MHIGPKYKIARRVGAPIFEKTQTQKYALRAERKSKNGKRGFSKPKSEFGAQLNEKQKARFIYGMTEGQFSNYVKEALSKKSTHSTQTIFEYLELRLDNAIYRMGLTPTRRAARQMVSHGHVTVNGRKTTVPSRRLEMGDVVAIRPGSTGKALFRNVEETMKNMTVPSWISFDGQKKTGTVMGMPQLAGTDTMFDLNAIVEFYSR